MKKFIAFLSLVVCSVCFADVKISELHLNDDPSTVATADSFPYVKTDGTPATWRFQLSDLPETPAFIAKYAPIVTPTLKTSVSILSSPSFTHFVTLTAPTSLASSLSFTLPSLDGSTGQALKTNGSGVLSFGNVGTVTSVSGTAPIQVATGTTTPAISVDAATTGAKGVMQVGTGLGVTSGTVSVTYGTTSATAAQGNDSRITGAVQSASTPGGDLAGSGSTYAVPVITDSVVTSAKILDGTIVNADLNSAAAVARTKIASGTADHVVINSGTGALSSEAQLATTRGGTGVNASNPSNAFLQMSPLGGKGDLITSDGTDPIRVGVGTNGYILTADSSQTGGFKWAANAGSGGITIGDPITGGTANSILYSDGSTNIANDAIKPFTYDSFNHRLGVGITAPLTTAHLSADGITIDSAFLNPSGTTLLASANSALITDFVSKGSNVMRFSRTGGALDTPTTVADTNSLMLLQAAGYDGTSRLTRAQIEAKVNGAVSTGTIPTDLIFSTGAGSSVAEHFRIKSDGTLNMVDFATAGILHNNSSGNLTSSTIVNADVSSSAAIDYSKLATMTTGQVLLGNAGTPTATTLSGDVTVGATGVTAIGASKVTNTMLAGSIDLTAKVTGLLPIANGGTNKALTLSAGGVPYFSASSFEVLNAGTAGKVLTSGGASAPTWSPAAGVAAMFSFGTVATLTTTATTATFATDVNFTGPTVTYNNTAICSAQTTDVDGPRVTCNSALAGIYTINWSGLAVWMRNDTANKTTTLYCSDGTTTYQVLGSRNQGTDDYFPVAPICKFYYSGSGNRSWDLRMATESAGTMRMTYVNTGNVTVEYSPIP